MRSLKMYYIAETNQLVFWQKLTEKRLDACSFFFKSLVKVKKISLYISDFIKKDNMIKEYVNWGDQFKIEFSIMVTNTPSDTWTNVFHFTGTDNNCCNNGDRIPAMWINHKKILISASVNDNGNYWKTFDYELNHKDHIIIQQLKDSSGLYWYEIIIDGVLKERTKNKQVKTYPSVKLYASDPWHGSFTSDLGLIFNFKVQQIEGLLL